MADKLLNVHGVRSAIRKACEAAGSQKAWCEQHGVSPSHLSDLFSGRRSPSKRMLAAIGARRVVAYSRVAN